MTYKPTYLPDGRKEYNPSRTQRDIHDEWDAFEDFLRSQGITDEMTVFMTAREMWRQEEEYAERYNVWQQRVFYPRMRALQLDKWESGEGERGVSFNKVELEFLVEHFAGANDPTARAILEKVTAALIRQIV